MAALTTQPIVNAGTTEALVAATAGGDTMVPGTRTFLKVNNASASAITVTITCQVPCSYGSGTPTHDLVVTVAAGAIRDIGFVDPVRFGRSSDGAAVISYSAVTSVTVGVFSL